MSATTPTATWRRRGAVIALGLAAFGGFYLVGRTMTNDETTDPAAPARGADRRDELPTLPELGLAGQTPNLFTPKPGQEKPTPTADPAPEGPAATPPPTEEAPDPTPVDTSVPPAPAPVPVPAPAPQPSPAEPPVVFFDD